jgi:hypothetical protein
MRERYTPILRIVCIALAAVVCAQLVRVAKAKNPLSDLKLSAASFTNANGPAATATATNETAQKPTNSPPRASRSTSPKSDLPPAVQARVDRIVQSEVLGAVIRPLPMALLGIAGKDAFIRGADGQTGLVREGEEFGTLKVLRIGTNRVLIEHEGQKKELILFSGFGSESLLPKEEKQSK